MSNLDSQTMRSPQHNELLDLLVPFMKCAPAFADSAGDRCLERGLLPGHLLACLDVLQFLSVTVLAAQEAQRTHNIRASVLLAMALDESGFDVLALARDPLIFKENGCTRDIGSGIGRWFNARAKKLAAKPFKIAARCHSMKRYIEWICDLGFGDSMKAMDLWSNIETYGLESCDLAGMLPLGEYFRWEYDPVKDDRGNLVGLTPNNLATFRTRESLGELPGSEARMAAIAQRVRRILDQAEDLPA